MYKKEEKEEILGQQQHSKAKALRARFKSF